MQPGQWMHLIFIFLALHSKSAKTDKIAHRSSYEWACEWSVVTFPRRVNAPPLDYSSIVRRHASAYLTCVHLYLLRSTHLSVECIFGDSIAKQPFAGANKTLSWLLFQPDLSQTQLCLFNRPLLYHQYQHLFAKWIAAKKEELPWM